MITRCGFLNDKNKLKNPNSFENFVDEIMNVTRKEIYDKKRENRANFDLIYNIEDLKKLEKNEFLNNPFIPNFNPLTNLGNFPLEYFNKFDDENLFVQSNNITDNENI